MKKILFVFTAFVAISFASCGNKTENSESVCDSDSVTVDSIESVDTLLVDSL